MHIYTFTLSKSLANSDVDNGGGAESKRSGSRKVPTHTKFGSGPPLSGTEKDGFRHGSVTEYYEHCA